MSLVKCQINVSPAGRQTQSPAERGNTDHCALRRWEECQQGEERVLPAPAPSPCSQAPCPARRSLASGLAIGPGSTNMLTYSKPSWLPRSLLPPSAQSYYMGLNCGREPNEGLVV